VHEATVQSPTEHPEVAFGNMHVRPHAPQWLGDEVTSISQPSPASELQSPRPGMHIERQPNIPHIGTENGSIGHDIEQLRHVVRLERSASQPSAIAPLQSSKPASHGPRPQTPAVHCALERAGVGHAFGHVPQCMTSLDVSASQPFAASASQSAKGAEQLATVHAPAAQPATPFATVQGEPHAPQCAGVVCGSTHAPSQQSSPLAHVALVAQPATHAPLTQRVPAAQSESPRQSTHVFVAMSHCSPAAQPASS
jgi:hypothetical protein